MSLTMFQQPAFQIALQQMLPVLRAMLQECLLEGTQLKHHFASLPRAGRVVAALLALPHVRLPSAHLQFGCCLADAAY
eukprot:CAMPEP_0172761040 /NCGR_PEP_ID=MMETSP1074-20121228/170855_1 /TAXON_ID=2916 /ORGANISM="Ceratium fusus, Strain PA161109" /LENGTH=77 /DNA_ID=CAMNT_0013595173 /DNA_START=129 /DNA_END=363 /DNA_ORIENTATION=-